MTTRIKSSNITAQLETITVNEINLGTESSLPTVKPSLMLDFENSNVVDPRVTFTRASTGRYYDGKTRVVAEQNLWPDSTGLQTVGVGGGTVTYNQPDPFGGNNAILFTDNSDSVYHQISVSNETYGGGGPLIHSLPAEPVRNVMSVYAKAGTIQYVTLGAAAWARWWAAAKFDLITGTVVQSTAGVATGWATYGDWDETEVYSGMEDAGNGWWRCWVSFEGGTRGPQWRIALANDDSAINAGGRARDDYVGDGTGTLYIAAPQVEVRESLTPTDYVATTLTTPQVANHLAVLQEASTNTPRLDFDPIYDQPKGLLMEEARTNLLIQSQNFSSASWAKNNATFVADKQVSPDGNINAGRLVASSTQTTGLIQSVSVTEGTTYTFSVYAKAYTSRYLTLNPNGTMFGSSSWAIYDLQTGTVLESGGASGNEVSVEIENYGNGWYRCIYVATASVTGSTDAFRMNCGNGTGSIDANVGESLYVWGAQLEAGNHASSYIKTESATATRAADDAIVYNNDSIFKYNEGTIFTEAKFNAAYSDEVENIISTRDIVNYNTGSISR